MPDTSIAILILMSTFLILMVLRIPIAFSVGLATLATMMYLGLPLRQCAQLMVKGINSYSLMAVPFFIVSGELMGAGGISDKLIGLADALVGWMRGGLAMVNCLDSAFFGGISGSAAADTASLGSILIPMMVKQGYEPEFSTNITLATSIQGLLIPPSHNMVIYAMVAGSVSVGRLFLAGIVPGITLGISLMIYSYFMAIKHNYPKGSPFSIKNACRAFVNSLWGLCTILFVMVGVVTGLFTATEAAAVSVVWAIFVSFAIYKGMTLKGFWECLGNATKTLSMVLILVSVSSAFGWLLTYLRVPQIFATAFLSITDNRVILLILINALLLFLGCIMDMSPIILVATPILLPIVQSLGMDPVQFGIIMIFNLGVGLITPPVGTVLFIGSAISHIKVERLAVKLIPIYGVMILVLMILTFVPALSLTLPNLLMPMN